METETVTGTGMEKVWEEQIESLMRYRARYQCLLEAMQAEATAFDAEDQALVIQRLDSIDTQLQDMRTKVEQREFVYETSVKKMMAILETRQEVLETVDDKTGLFSVDTELLQTLADRQRILTEKLRQVMTELAELS